MLRKKGPSNFPVIEFASGIYLQTKVSNNDGLDLVFTFRIISKRMQIFKETREIKGTDEGQMSISSSHAMLLAKKKRSPNKVVKNIIRNH